MSMSDSQALSSFDKIGNSQPNAAAAAATSYILGIDFRDSQYDGATFEWTGSTTCASTYYYTTSMPSGWNDKVSSAINYPYSGCGNWIHYENNNFNQPPYPNGASINCGFYLGGGPCFTVGSMNDKTSSEKWTG